MDLIHRVRSGSTTRFASRTAAALATLVFFALAPAVFGRPAFAARPLVVSPVPPGDPVALVINDQQLWLDDQPFIDGDRTMLPFRALLETVGASVEYDPTTHMITARRSLPDGGQRVVVMTIGSREATVDGQRAILDVPPKLYGERTFIPLRFASEALGAKVEWVDSWREARVTIDGELKAGTGVRLPLFTQEYEGARLTYYGMDIGLESPRGGTPDGKTQYWKIYASGNFDRGRYPNAIVEAPVGPVPVSALDGRPHAGAEWQFRGTFNPWKQWFDGRTLPNAAPIYEKWVEGTAPMVAVRVYEDRRDILRVPYAPNLEAAMNGPSVPNVPGADPKYRFWWSAAKRLDGRGSILMNWAVNVYIVPQYPYQARVNGGPWQTLTRRSESGWAGGWAVQGVGTDGFVEVQLNGWWRGLGQPLALTPDGPRGVPIYWGMIGVDPPEPPFTASLYGF